MEKNSPINLKALEAINERALQNEFFTPDRVYIEMGLMKDIPLGVVYADQITNGADKETFEALQKKIIPFIPEYQKRTYDSVSPFFDTIGYSDSKINAVLESANQELHTKVLLISPVTKFFDLLIRHTIRNQNNSRPAAKYMKKMIDKEHYVMDAIPVTYYFNIFPLNVAPWLLEKMAEELGESFGVNIQFLNKNPTLFDQTDWDSWMKNIDCFYFDSIGRFTRSAFVIQKQHELEFVGRYFFARKRFEQQVRAAMHGVDFDHEVQRLTAQMDIFCDFAWIQNNDTRLTEEKENVPVDNPQTEEKEGTTS